MQQVDTTAEIETRDLGSADHDPWADDGHGDSWSAPTDDWGGDDYHYGGKGGKSGSGGSDDDGWSGGDSHYHGHWVSFHPSRP